MNYTSGMFEILQSDEFKVWHGSLRDPLARARVTFRLRLGLEVIAGWYFGDAD